MAKVYHGVSFLFWVLGLLTIAVSLVARVARPLRLMLVQSLEMRSLLWLAGVFFLGAIATRGMTELRQK